PSRGDPPPPPPPRRWQRRVVARSPSLPTPTSAPGAARTRRRTCPHRRARRHSRPQSGPAPTARRSSARPARRGYGGQDPLNPGERLFAAVAEVIGQLAQGVGADLHPPDLSQLLGEIFERELRCHLTPARLWPNGRRSVAAAGKMLHGNRPPMPGRGQLYRLVIRARFSSVAASSTPT